MNERLKHIIYSSTECIPEQLLFHYIDNKLSAKERHVVEKHLLACEFCSDALEGMELLKNRKIIAEINEEIDRRIASATIKKETKIIFFNFKNAAAIAAGLLLLIGAAFFFHRFASTDKTPIAETKIVPTNNITDQRPMVIDTTKEGETPAASPEPSSSSSETFSTSIRKEPLSPLQVSPKESAISKEEDKNDLKSEHKVMADEVAADDKKVIADEPVSASQVNAITDDRDDLKKNGSYSVKKRAKKDEVNPKDEGEASGSGYVTETNSARIDEDLKIKASSPALSDSTFSIVTQMPVFPGGKDSLLKFIREHFVLPTSSDEKVLEGSEIIMVQFIIDTHGSLKKPVVVKGIDTAYDKEALRVLNLMPRWVPGKQNGKIVPVLYKLPIRLDDLK